MSNYLIPIGSVREVVVEVTGEKVLVIGTCTGETGIHQAPFHIQLQNEHHFGNFFRCPACASEVTINRVYGSLAKWLIGLIHMQDRAVVVANSAVFVQIPFSGTQPLPEQLRGNARSLCPDTEKGRYKLKLGTVEAALTRFTNKTVLLTVIDSSWVVVPL